MFTIQQYFLPIILLFPLVTSRFNYLLDRLVPTHNFCLQFNTCKFAFGVQLVVWIVLCEIIMLSNKHLKQEFFIKTLVTLMYIAKKLYNLCGNVAIFHQLWIFGWKHIKDEPLLF
jgi:hypothetical protein